jgi:hypothetical protein
MAEVVAYLVLIAIFVVAVRFMLRATKRPVLLAPPSAVRTPSQQRLNLASAMLLLPVLAYFAFLSDLHVWPLLALFLTFVVLMLLLRYLGVSWRVRIGLTPFVAAASTLPGALATTWPSLSVTAISASSWLELAGAATVLAASGVLSILSFPIGYGERKA